MISDVTSRGFVVYRFVDRFEQRCSLQESSLATEHAIWLGVDRGLAGTYDPVTLTPDAHGMVDLSLRMHLTRDHVRELLPLLQRFVETGDL